MSGPKTIFISHRGSEQTYADEVIAILTAMGHKPVDMSHWAAGDDFVEQMEEALQSCDAMIALLSPGYFTSDMCTLELRVAMKIAKQDRKRFLAPYKIIDVDVPELYATLIHGNFTNGVDEAQLRRRFPIENEVGEGKGQISNLPEIPTRHFFAQEQYIAELNRAILQGNAEVSQNLQGLGGVGKTTLAIHYARLPEVAARFPIRWWVVAETEQGLEAGFAALARTVGKAQMQEPDSAAAQKALTWLRAEPRGALILYDNAEDGALLTKWLPGDATSALVTTRIGGMAGLTEISLEVWPEDVASAYLRERTGQEDAEAALKLAQALGGLPLACEQAATYVVETGETLAGYLARFEASPKRMAGKKATGAAHENTVATTFALAIEKAAADCAAAPVVLSVMAELADAPLPVAVFGHEDAPEGLREAEDVADAIDALTRWALVSRAGVKDALQDVTTPCLEAHRLVRLAASDVNDGALERAARALGGAFPGIVSTNVESWPLCGALGPHALHSENRTQTEEWTPTEALNATLALNQAVIFYQYARADYATALRMIRTKKRIEENDPNVEDTSLAITLSIEGQNLKNLGGAENLAEARAVLERAVAIGEEALGAEHTHVAVWLSNLAIVLRDLGGGENLAEARAALERALKIDEAALGAEHPNVAIRLSNLANVLRDLGGAENLAEACAALERALKIDEAAFGADHPNVGIRLSNLANVLLDLGGAENLAEARSALERALKIDEAAFGADHPGVAIDHVNMAPLLAQLGDRAGALWHAERALAIFSASLGAEHGHTQIAARFVKQLGGRV